MTVFSHRVRYHEVDQQGFLFNGRYLEISDVALTEFFRALGWSYGELNALGFDPSVVTVTMSFTTPARFDDELSVAVTCSRVGTSSFGLRTVLSRDELTVATVDAVYVNVDAANATSRPIPDTIRGPLEQAAAEAGLPA